MCGTLNVTAFLVIIAGFILQSNADDKLYRGCFNESDELFQKYCMTVGNNTECYTCENGENDLTACNNEIFLKHSRAKRRGGYHESSGGTADGIEVLVIAIILFTCCSALICCCHFCKSKWKDSDGVVIRTPAQVIQQTPEQAPIQTIPLSQPMPVYGYLAQPNTTELPSGQTNQAKFNADYPYSLQTFPYNDSISSSARLPYDVPQRDYVRIKPTAPTME
ncbi:uncharacterized protein LOC129570413 isoform X2 [Sitodiplosis mosellana]|uniref:uncharacterized protein LOC129570413 isoform X2 n=1 Tax=Sitodiplosis mosellana TaxID=263140 RepID=UPI002443D9A7|nr:uncharacterized protein LOC129570413 isoform X2 [Sitodiplosis mosellana]